MTTYNPDYVSPPGWTLQEILEEREMPQRQLATRTGTTAKHVGEVVSGKATISPAFALSLERSLGVPARFWLAREARYREHLQRIKIIEQQRKHLPWMQNFPINEMIKYHYIERKSSKDLALTALLSFFGVAAPEDYDSWWRGLNPTFRRSPSREPNHFALAAWLRKGELDAQEIVCAPFSKSEFESVLHKIRCLTLAEPSVFQQSIVELCASCGVAVVFVPELKCVYTSGVARWLGSKPLIQLSLRYKTSDMLWFAFFHEAYHILWHPKRSTYLRDKIEDNSDQEREANTFAANFLIPQVKYARFARPLLSRTEVIEFAASIGIAPGIVVGRLQHDGYLPPTHLNGLKEKLEWKLERDVKK